MNLPDWLKEALSDGDPIKPQVSMSRLIAFITVITCIAMPGVMWFWLSGLSSKMLEFPGNLTGFVTAASGIALAMFAANKRSE